MCDEQGILVISLDFELLWGLLDTPAPMNYRSSIEGVRRAIPRILSVFEQYGVHATWGVVGFLMRESIRDCSENLPDVLPAYEQNGLSPYTHFGALEKCDKQLLFAGDLVDIIQKTPGQEIGTHTYSHYYCMEKGQTKDAFECDLQKAKEVAAGREQLLRSIVFPRNQFNPDYADVMKKHNLINYRGNERAWIYESCETKKKKSIVRRILRLLDNYAGIFGNHCYPLSAIKDKNGLNNIRSSRFLRPYSKRLAFLEPLRLRRICSQMTYAAKSGQVFHLWWHPRNMGSDTERNLQNLQALLRHYLKLKAQYGMESLNMGEIGDRISNDKMLPENNKTPENAMERHPRVAGKEA